MANSPKTIIMCKKCNKDISNKKEQLKCSVCIKYYEIDCANVSVKVFSTMTKIRKQNWKCTDCANKTTSMPSSSKIVGKKITNAPIVKSAFIDENITMRKGPAKLNVSQSMEDLSQVEISGEVVYNTSLLDESSQSLPNTSSIDCSQITDLRKEIETISIDLSSATNEIDRLNMEVTNLNKKVEEQQKKIELYKSLLSSNVSSSRKSTPNKSRKRMSTILPENDVNLLIDVKKDNILVKRDKLYTLQNNNLAVQKNENQAPAAPENNKILIIGGAQCQNLALNLSNTRKDNAYGKYEVTGFLKPGAPTEVLLDLCRHMQMKKEDKLILCVGEEDTDPHKLSLELYATLKTIKASTIILISVVRNRYLNEYNLNTTLKNVCNKLDRCYFINIGEYENQFNYRNDICKKINMYIDSDDYDTQFLPRPGKIHNLKNINRNSCKFSENNKTKFANGTIPYYFNKMNAKLMRDNMLNKNKKKTTLLDYFPIVTTKFMKAKPVQNVTIERRQTADVNDNDMKQSDNCNYSNNFFRL